MGLRQSVVVVVVNVIVVAVVAFEWSKPMKEMPLSALLWRQDNNQARGKTNNKPSCALLAELAVQSCCAKKSDFKNIT